MLLQTKDTKKPVKLTGISIRTKKGSAKEFLKQLTKEYGQPLKTKKVNGLVQWYINEMMINFLESESGEDAIADFILKKQ